MTEREQVETMRAALGRIYRLADYEDARGGPTPAEALGLLDQIRQEATAAIEDCDRTDRATS